MKIPVTQPTGLSLSITIGNAAPQIVLLPDVSCQRRISS
jgi:hypothetical protein